MGEGQRELMTIYQSRRSIRRVIKIGDSRDRIDSMQIAPSPSEPDIIRRRKYPFSVRLARSNERARAENRVLWTAWIF